MPKLLISQGQRQISLDAPAGRKLSQAIWLSGQIPASPLCNGLGLCGRCRCRFLENAPEPDSDELELFSQEALNLGWRLACRHKLPQAGLLSLELPEAAADKASVIEEAAGKTPVFLGYDLGTTSIQWQAVSQSGAVLARGGQWNPQAGAGADVISRLALAAAPEGLSSLSSLAGQAFAATVGKLEAAGLYVERACIAANSAMTCILLRKNLDGLMAAPYALPWRGNELLELPLPGSAPVPVYFPPLPSPFAGGDISAGLALLLEQNCPRPFLLIDLGTNAELALLTADSRLFLASAPLGPAMEGIGPQCGQPAAPGVITNFDVTPQGLMPKFYDDCQEAKGISATGYIALMARLLAWGVMNRDGRFQQPQAMPLARKLAQGLDGGRLNLAKDIFVTARDVEMLLKVKAALSVAIARILEAAGLDAAQLASLLLAGALGLHANLADLAALGFLPGQALPQTRVIGNSSLAGACLMAANPSLGRQIAELCAKAEIIDLANDPRFLPSYLAAMRWGEL